MKKLFFLFFTFILVFVLSAFSFAEDDLLNYRWVDVQSTVNQVFGSNGNVYSLDDVNITIWLPEEYISINPTEAELDNSCIGCYAMGNDSFVLINYSDSEGIDLDGYYNYRVQQGLPIEKILVNDIPAILQDDLENNSFLLMFQTQENKFLQFIFSPLSNPVNGIIMSSIQSTVGEEPAPVVESEPVEVPETPAPLHPVSTLISK